MPDFTNARAIVTGGSSGIGAAVATALHGAGAVVTVLDLEPPPEPVPYRYVIVNVTDDDDVRAAAAAACPGSTRLDVLVTAAGIGAAGTVAANDDDEWVRVLDINLLGVVRVVRAALPHLRRASSAAIVNVCSAVASAGFPNRALYSASKGAALALTRAMAADHLHEGIRVNCVNPGTTDTPWVARLLDQSDDPASARAALEGRQPHGRLVTAEEVAAAVLYLAGPAAGSTTGASLPVDGGIDALRLPS